MGGSDDRLVKEKAPLLSPPALLSSVWKTFGNLTISVVGAGVLGLPYAFKRAGWLAGSIVLSAVAIASYFSLMLLVQAKLKIESGGEDEVCTYSDVGFHAFGRAGRVTVDSLIFLAQGGGCVAFLIFIGENMASVFCPPHQLNATLTPNKTTIICIAFFLQILMAWIKSLTRLAPFSIFGTVANILAMAVVMQADLKGILFGDGTQPVDGFTKMSGLPFVAGVGIYSFSCSPLLIPIESAMQERRRFGTVLRWSISGVDIIYTAFALLGLLAFGSQTQDIITLNLQSSIQSTTVKVSQCVGLFFCFRVNIDPVFELLERRILRGNSSLLLRSLLLLTIAFTAIAVPNFGDFISLVGSSVSCTLGFILPPLFHMKLSHGHLFLSQIILSYSFIAFGVIFGSWGTISAASSLLFSS